MNGELFVIYAIRDAFSDTRTASFIRTRALWTYTKQTGDQFMDFDFDKRKTWLAIRKPINSVSFSQHMSHRKSIRYIFVNFSAHLPSDSGIVWFREQTCANCKTFPDEYRKMTGRATNSAPSTWSSASHFRWWPHISQALSTCRRQATEKDGQDI